MDPGAPAAEQRVLRHHRRVGAGHHDQQDRDREEREEVDVHRASGRTRGRALDERVRGPVHEPHDHDHADVRPEAVHREVGDDPRGQRDHPDVDQQVEEPERHEDQRQRQDREDRLDDRVRDAEHERAEEVGPEALDVDAAEEAVRDPQRERVDRERDGESDPEPSHVHGGSLARGASRGWGTAPGLHTTRAS